MPKAFEYYNKADSSALRRDGGSALHHGFFQMNGEKRITVTALDQKNSAAEGSEIIIMGVMVNGESYPAAEVFSQGWISEKRILRWRNYDQIPDMKKEISANFPAKSNVDIVFETNKWRGKAQVQEGNLFSLVYWVDCYSESSEGGNILSYSSAKRLSGVRVSGPVLFLCLFGMLIVLAIGFTTFSKHERIAAEETKREIWLDILKMVSAPMIVLIHTAGWPYNHAPVGSKIWIIYLFINTIPRFAVPVFIMISEILLIGKEHPPKKVWARAKKHCFFFLLGI